MRATVAAIFLGLVSARPALADMSLTESLSTARFQIYYTEGDYLAAHRVSRAAEEAMDRIASDLGYKAAAAPGALIPIYIYPNHRAFVRATGTDRRQFVLGRAHSGVERIELDSQELFSSLETVTAHEVAHIVLFRIVGPSADVPLWVHEGIAKFESADWDNLDAETISEAAAHGKIIPLSELARSFPKDREDLAYTQSASFFRYFVETYGRPGLRRLVNLTASTGSFDRALQTVTGNTLDEVEAGWLASLKRQYAPYVWARFVSTAAIGLLPILAILAFIAVRQRRRRLLEKYDQEEWEEANWRDWGSSWPGGR